MKTSKLLFISAFLVGAIAVTGSDLQAIAEHDPRRRAGGKCSEVTNWGVGDDFVFCHDVFVDEEK